MDMGAIPAKPYSCHRRAPPRPGAATGAKSQAGATPVATIPSRPPTINRASNGATQVTTSH
jgi:hypothetical protein